jgi:tetratricopeptide (TPR) repeat protein
VKKIGKYSLTVLAAFLLLLSVRFSTAQSIVTPHDLLPEQRIVVDGKDIPAWKKIWDEARHLAVEGEFEGALRQYKNLLILKSNLEEARWELTRLHMYLKQWDEAATLLEFLIEEDPGRSLYLATQGRVMWESGQYERAVGLFRRVYENNPADQTALAGLVEGLIKLGKKEEALPLLERLSLQEPSNLGVRRYLVQHYIESGNYEKARPHLVVLAGQDTAKLETLYTTAIVHEKLGQKNLASIYWQRVLEREPEHIEAHRYLAGYYKEAGQMDVALMYLQKIVATELDNMKVLSWIGEAYEVTGELDKALSYYERYLELYPDDREILRRVVKIYALTGRKKKTFATLEKYFAPQKEKDPDELKQTARRYDAAGRYHDAIALYRQLIERSPDDPEILAALANDLLAIGANEGALSMWKHLAEIAPQDLSIYKSMADLLLRLGRYDELLEVLFKIYDLDPYDNWTILQLAVVNYQKGELEESKRYFSKLPDTYCKSIECLQTRAALFEQLNFPESALEDYEALLRIVPDRFEARQKAIVLAARLGKIDVALVHATYLEKTSLVSEEPESALSLADAYRVSGHLTKAIQEYSDIIEKPFITESKNSRDLHERAWLGIGAAYLSGGLVYEAEQTLRTALASSASPLFIEALLELSLVNGRSMESGIWFEALANELENSQRKNKAEDLSDWQMRLYKARILAVSGDFDSAANICLRLTGMFPLETNLMENVQKSRNSNEPALQVRLHLIRYLLMSNELIEAERHSLETLDFWGNELELLVLLEQIYNLSGETIKAQELAARAMRLAEQDLGQLLVLSELYGIYENTSRQLATASAAAERNEGALAAKILLIKVMAESGDLQGALEQSGQLLSKYPENTWSITKQIEFLARTGNYEDALKEADNLLGNQPARADILLLKARILWEKNLWADAIKIYESFLEPGIEEVLEQQIDQLDIAMDLSPKSTFWNRITFSEGEPLNISEIVMSPVQASDFSSDGQKINNIAATSYALFRWQKMYNRELEVRQSVKRRNYNFAAKQLENLIEDYGSDDFLLYDLAGLYSKLERLGDESQVYKEIVGQNSDFPGLSDAVQRNRLKRRPSVSLSYLIQEDDGWLGYVAIRKELAEASAWYANTGNQEWSLDLGRIKYESTDSNQNLRSWRGMVSYDTKLSQTMNLSLGGGVERLENGYDSTPLLYGAFLGRIGDEMQASLSFRQDVTADTIASLTRNIIMREYDVKLLFDLLPRLLLGGDYVYRDYSDDNWTKKYNFWTSYLFIPDPTLLKVSYKYDYYDSKEGPQPGVIGDDGFAPDDHPYWSPQNYWITRFSFYFKHQLSNDALARGVPSYYTLEYTVGYDSLDNDLQEFNGSISLELFKHLTVSATYGYSDLDVYQHEKALLTLMLRW